MYVDKMSKGVIKRIILESVVFRVKVGTVTNLRGSGFR